MWWRAPPAHNVVMDRALDLQVIDGEIALVIDYSPGQSRALDVLGGAMALIASLDALDAALLSSISTELEPVSILNDIQHSSLKVLLARVLKSVPDDHLGGLEWKKWIGGLLVKGKHALLQRLADDAPAIEATLRTLEPDYRSAPSLVGYDPPKVKSVQLALRGVSRARDSLGPERVIVQTELGDVVLAASPAFIRGRCTRGHNHPDKPWPRVPQSALSRHAGPCAVDGISQRPHSARGTAA